MKRYLITMLIVMAGNFCPAQSNSLLVRHDTTLLKAAECEWIIKSLSKNGTALTTPIGKSVPEIILAAIKKGMVKAIDPETEKPIPAKEIFTWKMSEDSTMVYDEKAPGQNKIVMVKHTLNAGSISQIRIFQDWYLNTSTGALSNKVRWIELLTEVITSSGIFLGYRVFCKITY